MDQLFLIVNGRRTASEVLAIIGCWEIRFVGYAVTQSSTRICGSISRQQGTLPP
jgi:hypothetical protein